MASSRNILSLCAALIACAAPAASAQAATFTVNTTVDHSDGSPGDGVCSGGRTFTCSLRAAVEESNGLNDTAPFHTVVLPAGTYTLTAGVLPVTWYLDLVGAGARSTIIDQSAADRVLRVTAGSSRSTNISGVTLRGGEAHANNGSFGGNLLAEFSDVTLTNSTVTGGTGDSGGGLSNTDGTMVVRNSTIAGNAASTGGGDGGAIQNGNTNGGKLASALVLENSTISGNTARLGGGIISGGHPGNTVAVTNSTITGNGSTINTPRGGGGGLLIGTGTATVQSSIVALNASVSPAQQNCSADVGATITSLGFNLESGTDCGFKAGGDLQARDPQLGKLANNNGQTDTHALAATSPAVDAAGTTCPSADQRGVARPHGPACDIGAYEFDPPQTTITGGPSGPTRNSTPAFSFVSDEANPTFECRVDGAAFTSCTSPHTTAALGDGQHTFEVRAIDALGQADQTPASRTFTVDTAPPETTITSGPSGPVADGTPTFEFNSSESGSSFQCRVDTAEFASCSSPHTTAALADGPHTFEVRAIDALGNADPTPAGRTFTVAATSPRTPIPDTVIASGPSFVTRDRTPVFTFSSNVAGATFECSLDDAAFSRCSSPFVTSTPLRAGRHTFAVRARGTGGNVDPTPATSVFVIPAVLADLPRPTLGRTFNIEPVGNGPVLVSERAVRSRARASATVPGIKGRNFIPLREARQVSIGSIIDTRKGRVRLLSARDSRGKTQSGEFLSGVFQVLQSRRRSARGLTELRLKGSSFRRCRTSGHGKQAGAARHSRRRVRRVRGNAKGRFRTRGRYSAATVRGTIWDVSDRCDGTLTKVRRGKVAVRDFRRRKNILVRAGKSYLARPRR